MPGVYISFPFCAQKCTYCNFASGVFPRELEQQYLRVLAGEIREFPWKWKPETVYIGGGTPSRLDPASLAGLLNLIPGRPWEEATIEVAPGDVTLERARAWREARIDRVSLGVQSFVRQELAQTGRKHSAETVVAEVDTLRAAGIVNISIDLIAGLPFQTVGSFSESLDWVLRLGVPHVSVYMLEVDEESRLGIEILRGGGRLGAAAVPVDNDIASMYELALERLSAAGRPRYEISNFAKPGFESRHNLKYWRLEPYIGFGADAHSLDGGMRWQNAETAVDYVRRSPRPAPVAARAEEERFFIGLRLAEGIPLHPADWQRVQHLLAEGLMERSGDRVRLTDRGVLYSNEVLEEFVNL